VNSKDSAHQQSAQHRVNHFFIRWVRFVALILAAQQKAAAEVATYRGPTYAPVLVGAARNTLEIKLGNT
jgi:hypothetical protein